MATTTLLLPATTVRRIRQTEQAPTWAQHVYEASFMAPTRDADLAALRAALSH
jgi:hypothetical protein